MRSPENALKSSLDIGKSTSLTAETNGSKKPGRLKKWGFYGLIGAVLGSGALTRVNASKEDPSPVKLEQSPTLPHPQVKQPITRPFVPPSPNSSLSEIKPQDETAEVKKNIHKFFNLSREEFEEWAEKHPFTYASYPWSFPRHGETIYDDLEESITYSSGLKIEAKPSLFIIFSTDISSTLIGVNLGYTTSRSKNGDETTTLWIGSFLPEEFSLPGRDKIIFPVVVNVKTKSPQFNYTGWRQYWTNKQLFVSQNNRRLELGVGHLKRFPSRPSFLNYLRTDQGNVIKMDVNYLISNENAGLNTSAALPIYRSMDVLFEKPKKVHLFWKYMEDFRKKGMVVLQDNSKLPKWAFRSGSFGEISNHAVTISNTGLTFFERPGEKVI